MTMGDWRGNRYISSVKMNIMGIDFTATGKSDSKGRQANRTQRPTVDREDLYTPHHLEWYNFEDNE